MIAKALSVEAMYRGHSILSRIQETVPPVKPCGDGICSRSPQRSHWINEIRAIVYLFCETVTLNVHQLKPQEQECHRAGLCPFGELHSWRPPCSSGLDFLHRFFIVLPFYDFPSLLMMNFPSPVPGRFFRNSSRTPRNDAASSFASFVFIS